MATDQLEAQLTLCVTPVYDLFKCQNRFELSRIKGANVFVTIHQDLIDIERGIHRQVFASLPRVRYVNSAPCNVSQPSLGVC